MREIQDPSESRNVMYPGSKNQYGQDGNSPILISRFNLIPNKIPERCFVVVVVEIVKLPQKFIWKSKGFRTDQTALKKRSKAGQLKLQDFKTAYRKSLWCWPEDGQVQ